MARRYDSGEAKRRVLAASARLFLEKGYTNTKLAEILKAADVSAGSFQNIFRSKDGMLAEFVGIMFSGQFGIARALTVSAPSPAHVYAVETALQLALTEMSENLRDIYVEAYTYPAAAEIIHRRMAGVLHESFGRYLPEASESDFYEMELGTAGMMRSFMARPCNPYFTLEKKVQRFLEMALSVFHVPADEKAQIIAYAAKQDTRAAAKRALDELFQSLSMQFELNQNKMNHIGGNGT